MALTTAEVGRERSSSSAASRDTRYYSPMLTSEELESLKGRIVGDADLTRLRETLAARSERVLREMPPVPRVKAFLSRDGGVCPLDGAPLAFDPWSPDRHRCTRCGTEATGERHHGHWARAQHLWLAERAAELALLSALADDDRAAARATELLAVYEELYFALPNRDNVLGPSHLFFSTYLESLWLTSWLAAAFMLRESGRLSEERVDGINRVADEAARIIADFNEGLSNRQTWHAAALTAIAAWFGDADLAKTAVEERTGLLGHLADGFGEDGLWWEGENYHLFALRGVMQGIHWARAAGYDLLEAEEIREHFRAALLAPTRSALPDFTYPARRDSRYGISLAEASSLELWEIGRAWLGGDAELDSWLGALYRLESPDSNQLLYDAWLHDAGRTVPEPHQRSRLSWWALTAMEPAPEPGTIAPWQPGSVLLAAQGLAVLRHGTLYASLECGRDIGGHGHPDRLHLTLHADGVHWLPDAGTGSYVDPVLEWYRSSLAHNAPRQDGVNAGGDDAWCEAFESDGSWSWCRARAGKFRRTLVVGPDLLLDVLDVAPDASGVIDLPWHFEGQVSFPAPGTWEPAALEQSFVTTPERLVPGQAGPSAITVTNPRTSRVLQSVFDAPGAELLRAEGPGLPNTKDRRSFLLLRADGGPRRWITALSLGVANAPAPVIARADSDGVIEVAAPAGLARYQLGETGLIVEHAGQRRTLAGLRAAPPKHRPFFQPRDEGVSALAPFIHAPPALDGTLAGFDTSAPFDLDSEHQYRRSEEPYDADAFSARAWINWDGEALYLAVVVSKPEVILRGPASPPLQLDNEAEDINADGLQIYLGTEEEVDGALVTPEEGGNVACRPLGGGKGLGQVGGVWNPTELGYLVTLRIADPRLSGHHAGNRLGFDLLINEMQPDRLRRAGQLVWSGGGGWIYLRGDRHDLSSLGVLELG